MVGEASRRRERLMLWTLGVLALFAFQLFFPSPAEQLFGDVLSEQIGVEGAIDVRLIGNLIWIALLLFALRYYQTAAYIERLYPYLHKLEDRVNEALGADLVTREGKSYLADYPRFQSWLAFLYQKAIPGLLLLLPTVRIGTEMADAIRTRELSIPLLIDVVVYGLFAGSTLLYLQMVHARRTKAS